MKKKRKNKSSKSPFLPFLVLGTLVAGVTFYVVQQQSNYRSLAEVDYLTELANSPRGYLTTPQELGEIKSKAQNGIEPYKSSVSKVIAYADNPDNSYTNDLSSTISCGSADSPTFLKHGSPHIYSLALSYHLTGNAAYAEKAISMLDTVQTINSIPEGQCQLNVSWHLAGFVWAADLLQGYPGWTVAKKTSFQNWLAGTVYPKTVSIAERRVNNWAAAAAYTSTVIADYMWDRKDIQLSNRTPENAYKYTITLAKDKINGKKSESCGSCCDNNTSTKSMIRPDGGIPDEIRRGSGLTCASTSLIDGSGVSYTQVSLSSTLALAELLLRRGDKSLYDNVSNTADTYTYYAGTAQLPAGRGSIKKALQFLLKDNVTLSQSNIGIYEMGYRYYRDSSFLQAVKSSRPTSRSGQQVHFVTLTHGFADNENPGMPPTVPAPGLVAPISITQAPIATKTPIPTAINPTVIVTSVPTATKTPASPNPTVRLTTSPTIGVSPVITTLTLNPIADAYVRIDSPTTNYGTRDYLESHSKPKKISYLKFDLKNVTSIVKSARMQLYVTNTSKSTQYVWLVEDTTWTETGITYNNKPNSTVLVAKFLGGKSGSWVNVDLTSIINTRKGGQVSLSIDMTGTDGFDFASRESSRDPKIIVTY